MTDTHESCLGPEIPRPELGCSDCYFGGRKRVGSRGDPTSRFVIIGESPGIMEIADGVPFIGPSGHLLEQVLDQVGINISERPYILNAIKCYPRGLKSAETLSVAAARCHMHLMEELSAYPRDVILTLGNAALWTITGDYGTKITRVRGQVFKSSHARVGVVASVHPAFLLYGGGNLKQFRGDIALALKLLREGLPLRMEDIRYGILDKPYQIRQLAKLLHRLDATDLITADIETEGFSYLLDGMVSTGIQFKDYAYIFRAELSIPDLWTSPARYNWHNGKFDTKFHHQRGEPARCDEDTMLLSYALNERRGIHDLDQLGIDHLKMDPHKGMLAPWEPPKYVRKSVQSIAPFEVVAKYQAIDIAKTHKLASVLLPQVDADPNASKLYHNLLMPASNFLTKVEKRGICVDVFWTQKNNAYLEANCNQYEAEVNKIASDAMGHEINVRSWQQLKKLLYGTLALGPMSKRTDEDTLREILRTLPNDSIGHHVITNQLLYRGAHKQWRTYTYRLIFDVLDKKQRVVKLRYMGPDGRVHATFLIHGTATGRLSSREPNNQNQPRDPMIRGQYVAALGRVFIEPDLSQAELRSLACLSHDPILLAIFNSTDRSLHDEVATKLFGTGFSGEEKMIAKNVNFGIVYGITAVGLYLQLVAEGVDGYTVSDCQAWLDGWGEQFPTAWGFISKCRDAVLNQQTIITLFGRKKRHGVIAAERLKSLQDEASNMPHQSIASDIVLKSSINVDPIIEEQYNADIVNLVHDSNLTEVNDDEEKARSTAIAIMDEFTSLPARMGLTACPFVSDCKIGKRWGEAKNVRRKDIVMRSGKILRAHPEWVQNATDFMRGWNPKKDAYPIWDTSTSKMEKAA